MIILASKSPRRRQLLKEAGINFICVPAEIKEKSVFKRPAFIVRDLAKQKALAVASKKTDMPVLGSDTLVYCKGEILGKPKNIKDALRMLKMQNNSWQTVYTGVALVWKSKGIVLSETAMSHCRARKVSDEELKKMAIKHLDKAGAYAVQDKNDKFISKIEGDFDTIVGLSVSLVKKLMAKAGVKN